MVLKNGAVKYQSWILGDKKFRKGLSNGNNSAGKSQSRKREEDLWGECQLCFVDDPKNRKNNHYFQE